MQEDLFAPKSTWAPPDILPDLRRADELAIDTETCDPNLKTKGAGWATKDGYITGISVTARKGQDYQSFYLPMRHLSGGNLDPDRVLRWAHDNFRSDCPKIMHNAPYDLGWLGAEGVEVHGKVYDTMCAAALLDENRRAYGLDALAKEYGCTPKDESLLTEAAACYRINAKSEMWKLHSRYVGQYAEGDTVSTMELWHKFRPMIKEANLGELLQLECGLIPMLVAMRRQGVRVDIARAEQVRSELSRKAGELKDEVKRKTGVWPEVWAAESLKLVFDELNIPYGRTPTGKPSFTKEFLQGHPHEIPKIILQIRKLEKTRDTFVRNMVLEGSHNGRIHCEFHGLKSDEGGTVSGRFCIAKGQKVQVPGGTKKIEDIKKGDLVYTFDKNRKLTLKPVSWSGKTGTMPVVRIEWRGAGNKHTGELRVTRNHEIRLYDGAYVRADELKPGDSVLALHREQMSVLGYNRLHASNGLPTDREGRFVFGAIHGYYPEHVHHINGIKTDDRPENLKGMTQVEHTGHHGRNKSPEVLKSLSKIAQKRVLDPSDMFGKPKTGTDHPGWLSFSKGTLLRALLRSRGRPTLAAKELGIYTHTFVSKLEQYGINWKDIRKQYGKQGRRISKHRLLSVSELSVEDAASRLRIGTRKYHELREIHGLENRRNHRIMGVSAEEGVVDVYDIEVEETHNFICEEVCVHNSSSNPNLQQVSARDPELGPLVRSLFLPEDGTLWGAFDYSSQEPRLTVHYAYLSRQKGAEEAVAGFHADERMDYHQMVADMAGISRKAAKTINLGLAYGMGGVKLCHSLGLPTETRTGRDGGEYEVAGEEGLALLEKYHEKVPFVKGITEQAAGRAASRGYIRTLLGRYCRFDLWEPVHGKGLPLPLKEAQARYKTVRRAYTHKALNRLIQGSAADMTKRAMLDMWNDGITPMLTIHDELDVSVEDEKMAKRCEEIMRECVKLTVPVVVDAEFGKNWAEALDPWEKAVAKQ